MSVRYSLLAILDQGSCYGSQLRAEFERRTGSTRVVNVGQVYATLDRLERDRLVERSATDRDGQIHYTITPAGSTEVARWLRTPVELHGSTRDELAIKITMAVTLHGVDAAKVFDVQRSSTRAMLRELREKLEVPGAQNSAAELVKLLVLDAHISAAEAELRWLDQGEVRVEQAVASGLTVAMPLSTELPKRGRPAKTDS